MTAFRISRSATGNGVEVNSATAFDWRAALKAMKPEKSEVERLADELELQTSEGYQGHPLGKYPNTTLDITEEQVSRIQELTGITPSVWVGDNLEEFVFKGNGHADGPVQTDLPDMPFIVEDANLIGFARAIGDAVRRMPLSIEERARAVSLLNEELGKALIDPNHQ
jgi:hypothetical protein